MIVRIQKTDAAKTIHLQLANLGNKRTRISLFDVNGVGWFFKTIYKQNGMASRLMANGDFLLIIERNGDQHRQSFSTVYSFIVRF